MRRRPPAYASAFAYTTPTSSAPTSPGPWVTATASTALQSTPASVRARSTTAGRAARCARLANSGTTPPNTRCTSCDRMTRLASSGARPDRSLTSTAAEACSQGVSIPRTTSATAGLPLEGDGIGHGPRADSRGRRDGEPGVAAGPRLPDQVRDHAHAVLGEGVHFRLGPAHRHGHPLGRAQKPGEPGGRGGHGDRRERALDNARHFARDRDLSGSDAPGAVRRGVVRDPAENRAVHPWADD